jgi:hypothetical protein
VQGLLPNSIYVRSLPRMPALDANEGNFLKAMVDVQNLWTRINATPPVGFAPPLKLPGGYIIANLNTDLAALRTAYTLATTTTQDASTARSTRDTTFAPVYERLVQYRKAVLGVLPSDSPLIATIPALSPSRGSTPEPVSASGVWNAAISKADITHTLSDNPAVDRYELRYSPNNPYKTADEQVIASHGADVTLFQTNVGLVLPGSSANFRVYVVLTTGNEKGSATVKIILPS